jgi:hypothetical protein
LVSNPNRPFKQADIYVSLFCLFLLFSCSTKDQVVAEVNDKELTKKEAETLMDHLGYDINNKTDWQIFLDNWVKFEVYRQELKQVDPDKSAIVQLKGESFMGELSGFYLEEAMILSKLDSIVKDKEIQTYYDKNKNSFVLQDYLVKALYLKIPKGTDIEQKIREVYVLKNDKDLTKLNSYAKLYAENFYFDDEQWVYFTELTKDIPLKQLNRDNLVLNRTKTYFSDEEFTYFINIIDFKLKDDTPPLEFLRDQIREIILSERINRLREQLGTQLYNDLKQKHAITIHHN